jgi:hypothetical protein
LITVLLLSLLEKFATDKFAYRGGSVTTIRTYTYRVTVNSIGWLPQPPLDVGRTAWLRQWTRYRAHCVRQLYPSLLFITNGPSTRVYTIVTTGPQVGLYCWPFRTFNVHERNNNARVIEFPFVRVMKLRMFDVLICAIT